MAPISTMIRPAGYNERRCIARDVRGLYGYITAVGVYHTEQAWDSDGSRSQFSEALKHCVETHPALSAVVQQSVSESPNLAIAPNIDLQEHLVFLPELGPGAVTPAMMQQFLEQVHDDPFREYELRPQWKLFVQPQAGGRFIIAFAISHVVADGMSLFHFHRTLQQALQAPLPRDRDAGSTIAISANTRLPPALDKAATFPISWTFFGAVIALEFLPTRLTKLLGLRPHDGIWCGANSRPPVPTCEDRIQTAVRVLFISADMLKQVLSVCKTHDTRLTGLLNQLSARSLAATLQKCGRQYTRFTAETPYDLRRCIPGAEVIMTNYVSAIDRTIEIPQLDDPTVTEQDWASAHAMTMELATASSTLNNQVMALLKFVSNFGVWVTQRASRPAGGSFSISNLGTYIPTQTRRDWAIEEMLFSQSADATSVPLNINVASARGSSLAITVTWWPGMLDVQDEGHFVEQFLEDVERRLSLVADTV